MKHMFRTGLAMLIAAAMAVPGSAATTEAYQSYIEGLLAVREGDIPAALGAYERVIEIDRDAAPVYRDLASMYWQAGKKEEAFNAANRLQELSGGSLSTQLFLGNFYLMSGQSVRARTSWEKALSIDPANESALLYLAAFYSSDNSPVQAIPYWEKYLRQQPESSEGYFQMGLTLEKAGKTEKAKDAYLKAISLKKGNPDPYLALAQLYEKQGQQGAAVQEYERYLAASPENINVLMYLGGLYHRMKNLPAAEETFKRAGKIMPEDPNVIFWQGAIAEGKKDWDQAIGYFERLRAKEETPAVLARLSYFYSMKKEFGKAVEYLGKAVDKDPQNPATRYLLGLAYMDARDFKKAEKALLKSLELKPDQADTHFHLGILYDQWDKFDAAVPELKKAFELDPNHSAAMNYLGYSFADRNRDLDEAEALVNRALEIDPDNGSYRDSLGWVYFRKGRYQEAERELRAAFGKLKDPVIADHWGDTLARLGDNDGAWDAYQSALARDPKNRKINEKVRGLEKELSTGTLPRKTLKRAAGNVLQVGTLRMNFTAKGETPSYNFRWVGMFHYSRPDKWRMELLGSVLASQLLVISNGGIQVSPRSLESSLTPETVSLLQAVQDYFNAMIIESFNDPATEIKEKKHRFIYKAGNEELVINRDNSTVEQYRVKDEFTLKFVRYERVEGLFIPSDIIMYSEPDRTSLRVRLQGFVLNGSMPDALFAAPDLSSSGSQAPEQGINE